MNLTDSNFNPLEVGSKVVCNVAHRIPSKGASGNYRDVKQGKVVGFNKNTVQVAFRDGTYNSKIKLRSIIKISTYIQPTRGRKVLMSLGTNLVEATVVSTTKQRYNVVYKDKLFQVGKHKVIKV